MSTKIYNGYITNLQLPELLEKFKELCIEIKKQSLEIYAEKIISLATYLADELKLPIEDTIEKIKKSSREQINTKKSYERLSSVPDLAMSCSVFPLSKSKTLILLYCDFSEFIKIWESLDYIKEYHYQNQTDKPENISKKDWENRRKEWDSVLGGDGWGKPCDNSSGFTFCERDEPFFKSLPMHIKFIPDDDARKLKILKNTLISERQSDNFDISEYMKLSYKINAEIIAGLHKKRLNDIILIDYTKSDRFIENQP